MKITILGSGAYGCALAQITNENKHETTLYSPIESEVEAIKKTRQTKKLPNIKINENIKITSNLKQVLEKTDLIIIAIPTEFLKKTIKEVKKYYTNTPICIATKGIEQDSNLFVYDIVKNILKTEKIAVISGPSFAIDIAQNNPVGLTLACQNKETIELTFKALSNNHFKLRKTPDIIGTEICGSVKNIIAIAAGMLAGLNASESTQAMLITESLHDIKSLIKGLGGNGDTVLSYAGFGDLLLTATSPKSRNYTLGHMIGTKKDEKEINNYIKNTTIEGLYTLKSVKQLVVNKDVSMPIIDLIEQIIYNKEKPEKLIEFLIQKP